MICRLLARFIAWVLDMLGSRDKWSCGDEW